MDRRAFTRAERALVSRLRRPAQVQHWLNSLPYNTEPPPGRATLRSFRGVVRHGTAHCLEAALAAAVVLEQHGYPPLVISFESIDELDHVIFVYRRPTGWGSVGRSRDPGLHGRKPVFSSPRALARSYLEPYVDLTGGITAYALVDMRTMDQVRLAAVGAEHLVRRAEAARHAAPAVAAAAGSHGRVAAALSRLQGGAPPSQADRLCGTGALERDSGGVHAAVGSAQSRSKSRVGFVTGSCLACLRASSNRLESASPRVRSAVTDCSKAVSRRWRSSARMRWASVSSMFRPESGSRCETMRPRLRSMTSVAPQQGHGISRSDSSLAPCLPATPA